jgi:hypothetical protein
MCGRALEDARGQPPAASPGPAGFDRAESHGMEVDADRLTETLASRLRAIVPDGFHVSATDGILWFSTDPGRFPSQLSDFRVGVAGIYVRDNLHNLRAHGEDAED